MDARTLWQAHRLAGHLSRQLAPSLPEDIWLLAYENYLILVRGVREDARSIGSVQVASSDSGMEDLPASALSALSELQDLVSTTTHTGWPGGAGRLMPWAQAHGSELQLGYLEPGATWNEPSRKAIQLTPFQLAMEVDQDVTSG